jgi:hypothetical protein
MKRGKRPRLRIRVRLDRVVIYSDAELKAALTALPSFRTLSDWRITRESEAPWGVYARARRLVDDDTHTQLFVDYKPRHGRRMPPVRIAVVPDDRPGLQRQELEAVFKAFDPASFAVAEIAVDISGNRINARFVRRHSKPGKARLRPNVRFPKAVWFGIRRSDWLLRGYYKPEVDAFRLEIQFNRTSLKKTGVTKTRDFLRLAALVVRRVRFYDFNWRRLSASLRRVPRPGYSDTVLRKARQQEPALANLLSFLRIVGVSNPDQFLLPMEINRVIGAALRKWSREWPNS